MPYAIYSKKTKVVSKLVHNLSSITPAEEAIEVSDDVSFTRGTWTRVFGQDVTGQHLKLYTTGGGLTTISPFSTAYTAGGIPYKVRNMPTFIQPLGGNNQPVSYKKSMPIYAAPHSWRRWSLVQAKYQAILAKNGNYQGVVGEEFDSEQHIDLAKSDKFTILGNSCVIAPGGYIQSTPFRFGGPATNPSTDNRYLFDTYYFATQPELPAGAITTWGGWYAVSTLVSGVVGDTVGEATQVLYLNDETPTTLDDGDAAVGSEALPLFKMFIKIYNNTTVPITLENYMLFVRSRGITYGIGA